MTKVVHKSIPLGKAMDVLKDYTAAMKTLADKMKNHPKFVEIHSKKAMDVLKVLMDVLKVFLWGKRWMS